MTAFLDARGIQCDYEPTGRLMVALTPGSRGGGSPDGRDGARLGLDSFHLLDTEAVRAEIHSPLYLGGVRVTGGGILDPVKLVDGLRAEAERIGVRVWERSPVLAVEASGAGARVRTARGTIAARRAVLATSAYTHHLLPQVTRRFIPLYDYILVSDPLTATQHEAIGWRGRRA